MRDVSAKNTSKKAPKKGKLELPRMSLEDLYYAPGHLIRRCQQIAVAVFFDEFTGWDVTPVQYAALLAIRERPGMEQRALVNHIAIDRSTVGSMLRTLEERGLVKRVTPRENQRVKQLFILPPGEQLLDETREIIHRVQERILAPLKPQERKEFLETLARVVQLNNELSRAPLRVDPSEDTARAKPSKLPKPTKKNSVAEAG